MKTRRRFLVFIVLSVCLLLGLLGIAGAALRSAGIFADRMVIAKSLEAEVLLIAAHVDDLISARQRADALAESEARDLLTSKREMLAQQVEVLIEGGGIRQLPPLRSEQIRGNVRHFAEEWTRFSDAVEAIILGRNVMRGREFLHNASIELSHRAEAISAGTEAAMLAAFHSLHRAIWSYIIAQLLLIGAMGWFVQRRIFSRLQTVSACLNTLVNERPGTTAQIPVLGDDEFGKFIEYLNRFMERWHNEEATKDRFLAAMSHEIRTPMNGVIGFLDNLRETDLNEQQLQYVRVIDSSARSLLKVINEILDFSKLSAGRMDLEEVAFDLTNLLEERIAVARQLTRAKAVRVELDTDAALPGLIVRGDPTRLRQILDNLLSNAVKFTESGSIRLEVRAVPVGEARIALSFAVSDTGIGMNPEQQRRLFVPFTQAEAGTTRKYGGTGLGLCIARELVDLMGGTMTVQSRLGEGTRFEFRFETTTARPEEQIRLSEHYIVSIPPGSLKKYWALLVDDTPTNLFLMETICQSIGLPYRTATNGAEAVEMCRKHTFDLIFMDIQMPVMDGYSAIREIRKLETASATQIIALTASAFQEDVDRALGSGSTGFLAKPFERSHLMLCIAEHLGIPVERRLREVPEADDSKEDVIIRQMYDYMREQYRISLGEIKMILAQTVSDWRPLLDDVIIFAKKENWSEVSMIMHRLKGQLGAIGLLDQSSMSATINAAIKRGEVAGLMPDLDDFVQELGMIFRAVEKDVTLERPGGGAL